MCKSYFEEVRKIISNMTDEDFLKLLCRAGLEIEIDKNQDKNTKTKYDKE